MRLNIKYIFILSNFFLLQNGVVLAQVGIGTPLPNASAQLDIVASDKGMLIPRISLTSRTDTSTIANGNVLSMMVFNTATISDIIPGYYYWDGQKWQRLANIDDLNTLANGGSTGIGSPSVVGPANPTAGDIYVDETTGIIYAFDGTSWVNNSEIEANNGLITTADNIVQLGGDLNRATKISTNETNTLSISGLGTSDLATDEIVMVDKNTGVLKKAPISSLFREEVVLIIADNEQVQFPTPLPITDYKKVNVYRNGVRIDFTMINNNAIKIEPEAICYQGDEIRIVQFY